MQKRQITINDISREANVSPATVSRVLNGNTNVSLEKTERVKAVVAKYNYTQNAFARALHGKSTKTIGFILPDVTNPYYSTIFYEFEKIARQNGYTVLLGNSQFSYDYESDLLKSYRELNVAGLIIAGGRVDDPYCDEKYIAEVRDINENIPILVLNLHPHMKDISQLYVTIDEAIAQLVTYLKSVGSRKLAIIGGNPDSNGFRYDRRHLYIDAARREGIEVRKEWIIPSSFTADGGRRGVSELFQNIALPDTIACMNDIIAIGALHELHSRKIDVPNEMMLTGFDGTFVADMSYPPLTGVAFEFRAYANEIFIELISRADASPGNVKTLSYTKVVIRESTKR